MLYVLWRLLLLMSLIQCELLHFGSITFCSQASNSNIKQTKQYAQQQTLVWSKRGWIKEVCHQYQQKYKYLQSYFHRQDSTSFFDKLNHTQLRWINKWLNHTEVHFFVICSLIIEQLVSYCLLKRYQKCSCNFLPCISIYV